MIKHQRTFLLAGITALLVVAAGVQSVWGAPSWLPEGTEIAGYNKVWDSESTFPDFKDPDKNVTLYTQLWFKNDTNASTASLIAAAMTDSGGSVFLRAPPKPTGFVGTAFYALLNASGISKEQWDSLPTIWDAVMLLLPSLPGRAVSQPAIPGMDKALLIEEDGSPETRYFIFGIAGERILALFSVDNTATTQFQEWIIDVALNNQTIASFFATWYLTALVAHATMFVVVAGFLDALSSSSGAPVQPAPSTASIGLSASLSTDDPALADMKLFASSWGVIANPPPIFGFEVAIIVVASAATVGLLAIKARKRRA